MLIGICGAKCAGKSTVAQFLIEHHGFKKLHIAEEEEEKETSTASSSTSSQDEVGKEQRSGPGASTLTTTSTTSTTAAATDQQHVFPTAQALLDFVTKRWRSRWVTTDVRDEATLDALSRRPFFLLISVDAPVTVRWQRWQQQQQQQQKQKQKTPSLSSSSAAAAAENETPTSSSSDEATSLASFVAQSDAQLYSAGTSSSTARTHGAGMLELMSRASVRLLNTSRSLAHLYASLVKLDLTDGERLRPGWDGYFMALASLAARRCNCMKRAVGCVLVDNATGGHRVVSTGYNGTPRALRNCGEGGCPRCNGARDGGEAYPGSGFGSGADSGAALATCLCLHAEENALLEAGRERIRPGAVLYCNTCPCLTCSIKIVQVGIGEVVYNQAYSMDGAAAEVFRSAGVKLRQFSPPANGLIHLEKMELY